MKDCWSRLECLAWFLNFKWQVRWCIFNKETNVLQAYQITSLAEILGTFHSKNNSVLNFGNFKVPSGRVYPGCPVPIQATAHLDIVSVLVRFAQYRWAVLGTTINFCQMKRDISVWMNKMTGPVKVDHLQRWSQIFWLDQTEMVFSNTTGHASFSDTTGHTSPTPLYTYVAHRWPQQPLFWPQKQLM